MKIEFKVDEKWKWAAKDASGSICFYTDKPFINILVERWNYTSASGCVLMQDVSNDLGPWNDSLHQIINGEFVKYVDLKVDDKVMVRECGVIDWTPRYFAKFDNNGLIRCFNDGQTSWTSGGRSTTWTEWRLPTEEELRGKK